MVIANAGQANAFYNYQKNIVQGFQEVVTQLQSIENLQSAYDLKVKEVQTLTKGATTANDLYLAGYASYLEVIAAKGSVLQAEVDQVKLKQNIFNSIIDLCRACGGKFLTITEIPRYFKLI